jgi:hypothetical protein
MFYINLHYTAFSLWREFMWLYVLIKVLDKMHCYVSMHKTKHVHIWSKQVWLVRLKISPAYEVNFPTSVFQFFFFNNINIQNSTLNYQFRQQSS